MVCITVHTYHNMFELAQHFGGSNACHPNGTKQKGSEFPWSSMTAEAELKLTTMICKFNKGMV